MAIVTSKNMLKIPVKILVLLGIFFLGPSDLFSSSFQDLENQEPNLVKRGRQIPLKGKPNLSRSAKNQKRSYDDQLHKLMKASAFVKGEECARIRWVKTLDCYYGSKNPRKIVEVPATIHPDLKDLGDFIKGCSAHCEREGMSSQKNILVPHVSYILGDRGGRKFVEGGFLTVPMGKKESRSLFFISGMEDWGVQETYNKFSQSFERYPPMQAMGGQFVGKKVRQDFKGLSAEEKHTERWFHKIVDAFPESVATPLEKQAIAPDKLYAIVVDMYSIWDVCQECQKSFRQEFFKRSIVKKIEAKIRQKGIRLPRNGLKIIYRVSSQQAYGKAPISPEVILQAGGGYDPEKGFDIKAIDVAQVTFATRLPTSGIPEWIRKYHEIERGKYFF